MRQKIKLPDWLSWLAVLNRKPGKTYQLNIDLPALPEGEYIGMDIPVVGATPRDDLSISQRVYRQILGERLGLITTRHMTNLTMHLIGLGEESFQLRREDTLGHLREIGEVEYLQGTDSRAWVIPGAKILEELALGGDYQDVGLMRFVYSDQREDGIVEVRRVESRVNPQGTEPTDGSYGTLLRAIATPTSDKSN